MVGFWIAGDGGGETDGGGAFSRGVLGAGDEVEDVLEELTLRGARVAAQQHVDLAAMSAARLRTTRALVRPTE